MSHNIDFAKIVPTAEMYGENAEETALLGQMLKAAEEFLMGFEWCEFIRESYFGNGVGGIVAIFLFRIHPSRRDVDDFLWVIVGDLPPAYLATDDSPTPSAALEGYIEEMTRWVDAVEQGKPVDDLIPVNVPPTLEHATMLRGRLQFLSEKLIPHFS